MTSVGFQYVLKGSGEPQLQVCASAAFAPWAACSSWDGACQSWTSCDQGGSEQTWETLKLRDLWEVERMARSRGSWEKTQAFVIAATSIIVCFVNIRKKKLNPHREFCRNCSRWQLASLEEIILAVWRLKGLPRRHPCLPSPHLQPVAPSLRASQQMPDSGCNLLLGFLPGSWSPCLPPFNPTLFHIHFLVDLKWFFFPKNFSKLIYFCSITSGSGIPSHPSGTFVEWGVRLVPGAVPHWTRTGSISPGRAQDPGPQGRALHKEHSCLPPLLFMRQENKEPTAWE